MPLIVTVPLVPEKTAVSAVPVESVQSASVLPLNQAGVVPTSQVPSPPLAPVVVPVSSGSQLNVAACAAPAMPSSDTAAANASTREGQRRSARLKRLRDWQRDDSNDDASDMSVFIGDFRAGAGVVHYRLGLAVRAHRLGKITRPARNSCQRKLFKISTGISTTCHCGNPDASRQNQ